MSPARWPCLSLNCLKWSRSIITTDSARLSWRALATILASMSPSQALAGVDHGIGAVVDADRDIRFDRERARQHNVHPRLERVLHPAALGNAHHVAASQCIHDGRLVRLAEQVQVADRVAGGTECA